MIFKKIGYIVALATLITVTSCRQFVELPVPSTQLVSSIVFDNDATATAVMSNVYLLCASSGFASGGQNSITMVCGSAADEFDSYIDAEDYLQVNKNAILPTNNIVYSLWSGPYSSIYKCNLIIEGVGASTGVTQQVKDQLTGEALFMRAFAHFYLAALYGNIPYVTTTDYRVNTSIKQTDYNAVLGLIIEDLKKAKLLLANDYNFTNGERVRPNKWSASALLARTYLYAGQWENAEKEALLVLGQNTLYNLTNLNDVFLKNSREAIWQLKPVSTTVNTKEGALFILIAKPVDFALKSGFVNGFESNDLRKQNWIGVFSNSSGTWEYPYKYKIRTGAVPLNEYSMVLRLAEQYLILAEARAKQGKLGDAIKDLDVIRLRAGLLKIEEINPNINKQDLLLAIEQERRVELFAEWGHRWFDLKRTRRIDQVLSAQKLGWKSSAAIFPISETEIKVNQSLIQNEGYQK